MRARAGSVEPDGLDAPLGAGLPAVLADAEALAAGALDADAAELMGAADALVLALLAGAVAALVLPLLAGEAELAGAADAAPAG